MASVVSIVNNALSKIGESNITALDENSNQARAANTIYEQIRDAVIRGHRWNFAQKRVQLAKLTTVPAFGFANEFQLPTDLLRVIRMSETDLIFSVEGRKLLTDEDEARIIYIARIIDPNEFDALFVEALSARLAAELAVTLTESRTLSEQMMVLFNRKMSEARTFDSQEGVSEQLEADRWIRARVGHPGVHGGFRSDGTV